MTFFYIYDVSIIGSWSKLVTNDEQGEAQALWSTISSLRYISK